MLLIKSENHVWSQGPTILCIFIRRAILEKSKTYGFQCRINFLSIRVLKNQLPRFVGGSRSQVRGSLQKDAIPAYVTNDN